MSFLNWLFDGIKKLLVFIVSVPGMIVTAIGSFCTAVGGLISRLSDSAGVVGDIADSVSDAASGLSAYATGSSFGVLAHASALDVAFQCLSALAGLLLVFVGFWVATFLITAAVFLTGVFSVLLIQKILNLMFPLAHIK